MKLSVVGTGNVGASLLFYLAQSPRIAEVLVMTRRKESATAAIFDAASADPHGGRKLCWAPLSRLSESDLIILACGIKMTSGRPPREVFEENVAMTRSILTSAPLKPTAIVILLAAPVDDLTVLAQRNCGLPPAQVFGFGGDLDRNRLEYILRGRGRSSEGAVVVGEHGVNAIPVYPEADDYDAVAAELRQFLGKIAAAGPLRNLATGEILGRLCDSIATDAGCVHHVCGYHPEHGAYLTWPFRIGRSGILRPEAVAVDGPARRDLQALLTARRARSPLA
jgi:L-lactate dehydrogenase